METKTNFKSIGLALTLFFILGWGVYIFVAALIQKLGSVQSDLVKTLVTSAVTAIVAVATLVGGKIWEQRLKIRQDIRDKKIPIYEQHIQTLFRVFMAAKVGKEPPTQQELTQAFASFSEKMIVWGSSEVIKAWGAFKMTPVDTANPTKAFLVMERLFKAIRKDLGNDVSGLAHGDLLRLFVNDLQNDLTDHNV